MQGDEPTGEALGVTHAPVAIILEEREAAVPDSFFATEAWLELRKRQCSADALALAYLQ